MKATNIGLLISNVLGSLLLLSTEATAAILVEPIVTTPNQNFLNRDSFGSDTKPLNDIVLTNAPDAGNRENLSNDTGYTINKLSLILLTQFDFVDEDVVWGDVNGDGKLGLSNIFRNITIAPDFVISNTPFPRLDLTDGIIPSKNRFTLQFITNPDLTPTNPRQSGPLVIGTVYDGFKTVPEPSSVFALTLTLTIGMCLKKCNLDVVKFLRKFFLI